MNVGKHDARAHGTGDNGMCETQRVSACKYTTVLCGRFMEGTGDDRYARCAGVSFVRVSGFQYVARS